MFILLAILDGMVHEWRVCWWVGFDVNVESFECVGDVVGHGEGDKSIFSVVLNIHPKIL